MSSPLEMPTMEIPSLVLRQLYTFGSLENTSSGVQFALKNRLMDVTLTSLDFVRIDGDEADLDQATPDVGWPSPGGIE